MEVDYNKIFKLAKVGKIDLFQEKLLEYRELKLLVDFNRKD